jgi:predicted nucleotide-binding protein
MDRLIEKAKGMVSFSSDMYGGPGGTCPICHNSRTVNGCSASVEFDEDKIEYGVYCGGKRDFFPQGNLLIPARLRKLSADELPSEDEAEIADDRIVKTAIKHARSRRTTRSKVPDPRAVFVVHGRDLRSRDSMFAFLRSIGLHPLEWAEAVAATGRPTPYVGEILDTAFSIAQAVVVLLTPDDEGRLREQLRQHGDPSHETELTSQARLNVIFEAGMAMGRFPDRTVIVEIGPLRPFSDIAGRHVIRLDNTTQRRQELAQRLQNAGCPIKSQWYRLAHRG